MKFFIFDTYASEHIKPHNKKRDYFLTRSAALSRIRRELKLRKLTGGLIITN